jgi:FkbM family methyltransferase
MRAKISRLSDLVRQDGILETGKLLYGYTRHNYFSDPLLRYYQWSSDDGFVETTIQGSQMRLDLNDPGISTDLLLRRKRETIPTDIFQEQLSDGDTHIDIGANIGYYALQACRLVGDSGQVWAAEPMEKNLVRLRENIELNGYNNIRIVPKAVSDTVEQSEMAVTEKSNLGTIMDVSDHSVNELVDERMQESMTQEIEVTTLDQLIKDHSIERVDSVRMDIEGAELDAVNGMKETLQTNAVDLHIELHLGHYDNPEDEYRPMFEWLKTCGYQPTLLVKNGERHRIQAGLDELFNLLFANAQAFPHVLLKKV